MTLKIAFANQKGGVGKTTSAISLGTELTKIGRKVLIVDLDPQCSATSGIGGSQLPEGQDLYELFLGSTKLVEIIAKTNIKNLDLIPGSKDLVSLELEVGKKPGRELILKTALSLLQHDYDYVFFDCPPSSGLLTLNALGAADGILIPLQAEYYALEGLSALMNTIQFVQSTFNPQLAISGVFITMFDNRTNLSSQVEAEAQSFFKELMLQNRIPRNVKVSEAPSHGLPIGIYEPSSPGAIAYRKLAAEFDARCLGKNLDKVSNA